MEIDTLRWWHWMVISLAVGALLGWANSGLPEPVRFRSLDSARFQQYVMARPLTFKGQTYPEVSDILIYPISKTPETAATKSAPYQLVTCRFIEQSKSQGGGFEYVSAYITTPVPLDLRITDPSLGIRTYRANPGDTLPAVTKAMYGKDTPEGRQAIINANRRMWDAESAAARDTLTPGVWYAIPWNPAEMKTIRDFLNAVAKSHAWIRPHYAWWKETRFSYVTWMGGCFLIVGVVIPALIHGIGGGRKEKEAAGDSRPYRRSKEPAKKPATTAITQQDMDQLAEIEATLQASLNTAGSPRMTGAAPAATEQQAPVRVLTGTQVEPIQPTTPAVPEEEKVFNGEYYPVAKTVKKHE